MHTVQIIVPDVPRPYEITVKVQYELWKEEKEAREPKFVIENVRFEHDPRWRERLFSITAIRDVQAGKCEAWAPFLFWNFIKILFYGGAFGFLFIGLLLKAGLTLHLWLF